MNSRFYRIGDVKEQLCISTDTLRYYEKIKLLPPVARSNGGVRQYDDRDLSRLRFIQRAQKMNFSLAEIANLLKMREDPHHAKNEVRELTANKLGDIECHLAELTTLRNELQLLLNLCRGSADGCPIIDRIDLKGIEKN
ncbi:MAG: heavy metal-responsive transcriptional regulator [Gammaproteobacteria bacterium]|nr:heavy metal-responsive transcriptional regulator [Gammaproteobacteria bacterium]